MLLGTLGASLLEKILTGEGIVRAGSGCRSLNFSTLHGNKKWKETVRVGCGKKWDF